MAAKAEASASAGGGPGSNAAGTPRFGNSGELRTWLEGQPAQWAQVIAARAVLRVLPLAAAADPNAEGFREHAEKELTLAALRPGFVAWAASWYPAHSAVLDPAARAAATRAASAFAAAPGTDAPGLARTAAAFAAASFVAAHAGYHADAVDAATRSVEAAARASHVVANSDADLWKSVGEDAAWLEALRWQQQHVPFFDEGWAATGLSMQPVWLSDVRGDARFKANLPSWTRDVLDWFDKSELVREGGWKPWVDWYRAILPESSEQRPGSAFGEAADIEIATAPDAFWDLDPDEVVADIGRVVRGEPTLHLARLREAAANSPHAGKPEPAPETHADFLADAHDPMVDHLDRAKLAFLLAGRLNQVWGAMNTLPAKDGRGWLRRIFSRPQRWDDPLRPGFVVHIDAPWGGGKTSFANLLTRILNPYRHAGPLPDWMKDLPLDDPLYWPEGNRRPWHVVNFNAWRHQHVLPPWWVFSQAIRKQCLDAVLRETNRQKELPAPAPDHRHAGWLRRRLRWTGCFGGEVFWRLWAPSMRAPALLSLFVFAALFLLYRYGFLTLDQKGAAPAGGIDPVASAIVTLILGGATTVWTLFNLFARTLFPGTPDAAANYALGAGDPLDRFRMHFARTMQRFGRPVVVVVDDLDRCEPGYVVELIRGMQTILVSPRVVFILLGDRDWIETAFSEAHKAMKGIDVGPEHEFGGRFVEKAIQFSFVLPDITPETRLGYVRKLLKLEDAPPESAGQSGPDGHARETFDRLSKAVLDTGDYAEREAAAAELRASPALEGLETAQKEEFLRDLSVSLSLRAAADETAERATRHMIEALAPVLPANPRQIKRIVNAISLMQEAARLKGLADPGSPQWQLMARWVVLMIEWPKSWYTLSRWPALADLALTGKAPDGAVLPATAEKFAARIRQSATVMALLDFSDPHHGWQARPIDAAEIAWLSVLMPATSGAYLELA